MTETIQTRKTTHRAIDNGISSARLRMGKFGGVAATAPSTPLVRADPETQDQIQPGPQTEVLMRLVALESLVEKLTASNDHLASMISHFREHGSWPVSAAPDPEIPDEAPSETETPIEPGDPVPETDAPVEDPATVPDVSVE